ncbi:MAG: TrkA family potassium uptake protein [Bacillota bacterium]
MFVIVAGSGRMGRHVAETLFESGHDVMVVDHSQRALSLLSDSFGGFTARGDISETETLRSIGIADADLLIASTGDDNVNLLAARMAHSVYGVEKVIVRTKDPLKVELFERLGFQAVCPILLGAERILDMLDQ